MNIRNITPEDLPLLSSLISNEELKTRTDICFEHSKLCIDDKGGVIAAVILRHNALSTIFGGIIPLERVDRNAMDYEEGDEHLIPDEISKFDTDEQYEIIGFYAGDEKEMRSLYSNHIAYEGHCPIGLIWSQSFVLNDIICGTFYNFNNMCLMDIPNTD